MDFGLVCIVCFFPYIFLSTDPKIHCFSGLTVKQSNLRLHYSVVIQLKHSILPYLGNKKTLCFLKTIETFLISLPREWQMFGLCLSLVKLFTFLIASGWFFKNYTLGYKEVVYLTLLLICCFSSSQFHLRDDDLTQNSSVILTLVVVYWGGVNVALHYKIDW